MPPETPLVPRWKITAGYVAFSVFAFVFFLYVTFPYQAVRDRIAIEAAAAGWNVNIRTLGPGLFGLTARDVQLSPAQASPTSPARAPITLSSVSVRPALFPPGLAYRANAFGGTISGSAGMFRGLRLSVYLDGLDPSDGTVKAATGIDAAGAIDGELSLNIPREEGQVRSTAGYDVAKAAGNLTINASKLTVKGGTVSVPMYGQLTPIDLPRIALGDLDGRINFDKGVGTIDKFHAKSEDLELQATGTVTLARRVDFSELNLQVKLKAEPEFVKRLGMIGAGLSALATDKDNPAFRVATITGFLGQPSFGRSGR